VQSPPAKRASMNEQLILDRYRLIERLAAGGSAEVWRAHDEQLDRPVAVKRLHPHLFADDASRSRLAAEARAAARLSHPVIVGIYDVDATGDAPALVMELVIGESLAARIGREGALPPREAAAIVADLAEALFHAHQQGVIHRDIKPGNILLDADGRTRLVDFGIAHSLAEAAARLTATGTVIGTPRSMAPEQLADAAITPRTDLYGLGAALHEALTARPPYSTGSPLSLAEAQRAGPPSLVGLDPALAAIVAGCLAIDPADRPLHAGALADALRAWLAGDPGPALALAPPVNVAVDTAAVTQPIPVVASPQPSAAAVGAVRRGASGWPARLVPIVAGLVAIAVVAVLVAFAANRPEAVADPSASPLPSSAPPSSAPPAWLAGLVDKIEKDCGADAAATAADEMAAMTEDQAKEYAEALVGSCTSDGEDDGGDNGNGRGNGNGNGNGNGRGKDD
jgi:tRNA A-37 threonylcarbamoyl transferase component Bud32